MIVSFFFFFQAEDGIRVLTVTGVQTCALPIYRDLARNRVPGPERLNPPRPFGDAGKADPRPLGLPAEDRGRDLAREAGDRKSTRLNSSHSQISYAVFCLKKKKNINGREPHTYA